MFIGSESKQCFQERCGGKSNKMFIYANTVPYSPTVKCVHICSHAGTDGLTVSAVIEKPNTHTKLHNSCCVLLRSINLYLLINV